MLLALALHAPPAHAAPTAAEAPYARVLAACVSAGRVDYACVRTHRADLDDFLETVAAPQPATPPLGFWIDAYNASVLSSLAAEPRLPKEVLHLAGLFGRRTFRINGAAMTLDAVEARARTDGPDARVHFAFNCAARSCPPLRAAPWPDDPASTGPALEAATAAFLATSGVTVDPASRELRLSKLFDWYRADFLREAPTVEAWVLAHLADPLKKRRVETALRDGYRVTFLPYDWTPNTR